MSARTEIIKLKKLLANSHPSNENRIRYFFQDDDLPPETPDYIDFILPYNRPDGFTVDLNNNDGFLLERISEYLASTPED